MRDIEETRDEIPDLRKALKEIDDALSCAECAETDDDVIANMRDAALLAATLAKSIKALL